MPGPDHAERAEYGASSFSYPHGAPRNCVSSRKKRRKRSGRETDATDAKLWPVSQWAASLRPTGADEVAEDFRSAVARCWRAECDNLSELVAAAGGDSAATVTSIGLLEPGTSERRAVIALSSDVRASVADLMRALQREAQRNGLDSRSQLMPLALAARDLLPADGEMQIGNRMSTTAPRHVVMFSGGKDSTALALVLTGTVIPSAAFEYVFCDTHKELPETYEYLTRIEACLGQPIERLSSHHGERGSRPLPETLQRFPAVAEATLVHPSIENRTLRASRG